MQAARVPNFPPLLSIPAAIIAARSVPFVKTTPDMIRLLVFHTPSQEIIEWREKVDYPKYLEERLPQDEFFYQCWPEHIFGEDKYGHPLVSMHISEMNTDRLHDIPECVLRPCSWVTCDAPALHPRPPL
jgi:hypothetical protein